jgi:hypothetical protein
MKKKTGSAKTAGKVASHKLGSKRNETAKRARKLDNNFKQSRDVAEDRGVRQMKSGQKNQGR